MWALIPLQILSMWVIFWANSHCVDFRWQDIAPSHLRVEQPEWWGIHQAKVKNVIFLMLTLCNTMLNQLRNNS
jgi:hypothetical protein